MLLLGNTHGLYFFAEYLLFSYLFLFHQSQCKIQKQKTMLLSYNTITLTPKSERLSKQTKAFLEKMFCMTADEYDKNGAEIQQEHRDVHPFHEYVQMFQALYNIIQHLPFERNWDIVVIVHNGEFFEALLCGELIPEGVQVNEIFVFRDFHKQTSYKVSFELCKILYETLITHMLFSENIGTVIKTSSDASDLQHQAFKEALEKYH